MSLLTRTRSLFHGDTDPRPAAVRRITSAEAGRGPRSVRQLVRNAERGAMPLGHLYGSFDARGGLIAAALMVPQAGRTGLLFTAKPERAEMIPALTAAADRCCAEAPPHKAALAQSLLTRGEEWQAKALTDAGFKGLTTLAYMQAAVPSTGRVTRVPRTIPGYSLLSWEPARVDLFLQALDGSYRDTQDCPGLHGMRDTRDVLAGHRAVGLFDPRLWTVALDGDRPVAVMLLNPVPAAACVELVYLGLAPTHRRRGLGQALMTRALDLCASAGHGTLTLAVDTTNTPAVSLYKRFAFHRTETKTVMVRRLGG